VALDALERCSNRPAMVRVLRENAGSIHSFAEFRARWLAIVGPTLCTTPPTPGAGPVEPPIAARALIRSVEAQIAGERRVIADLAAGLPRARNRARAVGTCAAARSCRAALERIVEPFAVTARLAQARLVLGRLEDGLTLARRMASTPGFSERSMDERLDAQRVSFERANQAILIAGLRRSIAAIDAEPGLARARSTPERGRLTRRLAVLTNARERRLATPSGLASLFGTPSPPVDVVRHGATG
jgi:hypothetical protein